MYRIDNFSDESVFQKGFNNYALKSLVELCNMDSILDDYLYSPELHVGCDKDFVNLICSVIKENKELILDELKENYFFNSEGVMSDETVIMTFVDAIRLTADGTSLTVPDINVEYVIARAIIENDEFYKDMFRDEYNIDNYSASINIALSRFFEPGKENDALKKELIEYFEEVTEEDYTEEAFAEYLDSDFFLFDLLENVYYDFDFEMIDNNPEVAKRIIGADLSLDELLDVKNSKEPTIDEYLGNKKQEFINALNKEYENNQDSLFEIVNFTMRGIQDHLNEPMYRRRMSEIENDLKIIKKGEGKITDLSEQTQKQINFILSKNENIR